MAVKRKPTRVPAKEPAAVVPDPTDDAYLAKLTTDVLKVLGQCHLWSLNVSSAKRKEFDGTLAGLVDFYQWAKDRPSPVLRAGKLERCYVTTVMLYNDMVGSMRQSHSAQMPRRARPAPKRDQVDGLLAQGKATIEMIAATVECTEAYVRERMREKTKP